MRKRETNMATEKIDMTDLYDKFLATYKQHMSVSMVNSSDRMFKTMAWNKERKRECCNKIWSPKTYAAVENEYKKAREKFNHNSFFSKASTKKGKLFINML